MIKLFRNIRKNLLQTSSTGKYLKYAIGEIVLVVIGILIALQVNDWNEHRKQAVQEQFLLAKLKTDLNSDIKILTLAISGTEDRIREYKFCLDVLAGKTVGTIIDFKNNFHSILTLYRFNKNKTTFNNLVESGKIELIKNQTLLDSIVSYYNDESHKGFDNAME
jgi:Lhr-like helicase